MTTSTNEIGGCLSIHQPVGISYHSPGLHLVGSLGHYNVYTSARPVDSVVACKLRRHASLAHPSLHVIPVRLRLVFFFAWIH